MSSAGLAFSRLLVLCFAVLLFGSFGCAHQRGGPPQVQDAAKLPAGQPPAGLRLDPTRIRAGDDLLTGLDGYDAGDLFHLGYEAFQRGDVELSAALYGRLVDEFPDAEGALSAHYNLGLSLEKLGDLEAAIGAFARYVELCGLDLRQDAAETRTRIAALLQRLGRVEESRAPLDKALAETELVLPERWEAQILYAIVTAQEGNFERAEWNIKAIGRAIRKRALREGDRYPFQSAMLWYHVGKVYRMRAASHSLDAVDNLELLDQRLTDKARDLLEARRHFKRCLRHLEAAWSGAAALALGGVYEDFRRDLLAAPKPSQLDGEHGAVYRELLEEATGRFLERAASDYREVLRDAQRYQLEDAWIVAISEALSRCEGLLQELFADGQETVPEIP